MAALPTGSIMLWYGSIASIPLGFVLCNGLNGSPDLRDRFLVGAGNTYAVDASGGSDDHSHAVTTDAHDHLIGAGTDIASGVNLNSTTNTDAPPGTTDTKSNLPPYYSLAYIMKT